MASLIMLVPRILVLAMAMVIPYGPRRLCTTTAAAVVRVEVPLPGPGGIIAGSTALEEGTRTTSVPAVKTISERYDMHDQHYERTLYGLTSGIFHLVLGPWTLPVLGANYLKIVWLVNETAVLLIEGLRKAQRVATTFGWDNLFFLSRGYFCNLLL